MIWPHGRWRFSFAGAGQPRRRDAARRPRATRCCPPRRRSSPPARLAAQVPDARATVGRLVPTPGGTNVIASTVTSGWTPGRPTRRTPGAGRRDQPRRPRTRRSEEGCRVEVDRRVLLRRRRVRRRRCARDLPRGSAACRSCRPAPGTTRAILAASCPTAMLFVRNPTGDQPLAARNTPSPATVEAGAEPGRRPWSSWRDDLLVRTGLAARRDRVAGVLDRRRRRPDHRGDGGRRRRPGTVPARARRCPGSPTRTRTPSTGRCAAARTHERGTFWTWRERMYALAARLDPDSTTGWRAAVYAEMVLAGYTSVGEFHYLHHAPGGKPYADPNAMGDALRQAAARRRDPADAARHLLPGGRHRRRARTRSSGGSPTARRRRGHARVGRR